MYISKDSVVFFKYTPAILLNKPARIPLATGTTTSPTPVTVDVIQVDLEASTKTPSTDCIIPLISLYVLDSFSYFLTSSLYIQVDLEASTKTPSTDCIIPLISLYVLDSFSYFLTSSL